MCGSTAPELLHLCIHVNSSLLSGCSVFSIKKVALLWLQVVRHHGRGKYWSHQVCSIWSLLWPLFLFPLSITNCYIFTPALCVMSFLFTLTLLLHWAVVVCLGSPVLFDAQYTSDFYLFTFQFAVLAIFGHSLWLFSLFLISEITFPLLSAIFNHKVKYMSFSANNCLNNQFHRTDRSVTCSSTSLHLELVDLAQKVP